jgi:hypothetical protein
MYKISAISAVAVCSSLRLEAFGVEECFPPGGTRGVMYGKYADPPAAIVTWILGQRRIGVSSTPKRLGGAQEMFCELHFGRKPISLVTEELNSRLVNGRGIIPIGTFDVAEGRSMVCKRLQDDDLNEEDLTCLLQSLDYVPLAISQAVAFIQENALGIKEYVDILLKGDEEMSDLLNEEYHDPGRDPEIQNSIFRTWKISFEQILK